VQIPRPRFSAAITAIFPKQRGFTCQYPSQLVISWAHFSTFGAVVKVRRSIKSAAWRPPPGSIHVLLPLLKVRIIVVQHRKIVETLESAPEIKRGLAKLRGFRFCRAGGEAFASGLFARARSDPGRLLLIDA
jgi:hypothetical protein